MREVHWQLDIETTDTDPKIDDILQIALVECRYRDGFWQPGRFFNKFLHTDKDPATQFAKDHMADLFKKCQKVPYEEPESVRGEILGFLRECGVRTPYVYIMGWNVSALDIPFMVEKGYLRPFYRQTIEGMDIATGDFHYRVYEQSGSISLAQCVLGIENRNDLVARAQVDYHEIALPTDGKDHDALYDCYRQLKVENGLIRLIRQKFA